MNITNLDCIHANNIQYIIMKTKAKHILAAQQTGSLNDLGLSAKFDQDFYVRRTP